MTFQSYFDPVDDLPTFGEKIAGQWYEPRPGSYALIFNEAGLVALMQTDRGFYLPGGGAEPGETPAEALQRELYEESGYGIAVGKQIGLAVDYIFAQNEGKYYEIQSVFLRASLGERLKASGEQEHNLVWCQVLEAQTLLRRPSQKWALQKISGRQTLG